MVNRAKSFLITLNNLQQHLKLLALKTSSKWVIQKTTEATGDLIVNTIANRITNVSRSSPLNNSERIVNEHDKEIPKEIYTSQEERQKIIDNQGLT